MRELERKIRAVVLYCRLHDTKYSDTRHNYTESHDCECRLDKSRGAALENQNLTQNRSHPIV